MLALAAAAGLSLALVVGGAAATGRSSARAERLVIGVGVLRFAAAGRTVRATGVVSATLTDNRGHRTTARSLVALTAQAGGGCRVLHLYLKQLNLNLLGLNAHLDPVVLNVTGRPGGGVLGSLFCRLARARLASARAAAARAMTAAVRRHRGDVVRLAADIRPRAAASSATRTCPVLDLVVGPLDLQLLGLVVDLNRVHLVVTATRGAGALGDLFCRLADNSSTTTTPATTTT